MSEEKKHGCEKGCCKKAFCCAAEQGKKACHKAKQCAGHDQHQGQHPRHG